jgi:uncharacterized protein YprB with RNaseH-like and TPR domain
VNESFRERLRRLRRDEPAREVAASDARASAPSSTDPHERDGIATQSAADGAPRVAPTVRPRSAPTPAPAISPGVAPTEAPRDQPRGARAGADRETRRDEPRDADSPEAPAFPTGDLRRHLARRSALRAASLAPTAAAHVFDPPRRLDLGPPERLAPSRGGALARVSAFAREHAHGACSLARGLDFDRALLAASARDERLLEIDLERAVFLDTETSGLSGGSGTYVFLVGLGLFAPERFEVWQGFLAAPGDERALLQETAERIAEASAIVSFFGKSFDRHRLEDKMRVHGVAPPFASVPHLDLYWPLRRAHQGRFENCRLKTLERELAGVVRDDDLPGSFAPAAWFDFLAGRPHRLEGVFRHNLEDVLSLVALLPHAAALPLPRS